MVNIQQTSDSAFNESVALNAYAIVNAASLEWDVKVYRFKRADGQPMAHGDRSKIKNAVWVLKKFPESRCTGYGYIIDISHDEIAVPSRWELACGKVADGYVAELAKDYRARAINPGDHAVVRGILREAVKKNAKDSLYNNFGPVWKDFDRYCTTPDFNNLEGVKYCFSFDFGAKRFAGNIWAIVLQISTVSIDGRSLGDYYLTGRIGELANFIALKQENRKTRQSTLTSVRVWRHANGNDAAMAEAWELDDPAGIDADAELSPTEQRAKAGLRIKCRKFPNKLLDIPLAELRLILDTQITQETHGETIIEPGKRFEISAKLRDSLHGLDAYGIALELSPTPVPANLFASSLIKPPALRVKGKHGKEIVIPSPKGVTDSELRQRMRERQQNICRNGFLQDRPIRLLLAYPPKFSWGQAERMLDDLADVSNSLGAECPFETFKYESVHKLQTHVEKNGFDAILAVLPEGKRASQGGDNFHEQIKRAIQVPSQCIHFDNTLPLKWVSATRNELNQHEPKLAKRIRKRYEISVTNLLVKHGWVPFAPADTFHFNVQVGIDVGGQHNNRAMACLGYGFAQAKHDLIFLPEEIPITVQQAEPIPTESLLQGLLQMFERLHESLTNAGETPDFSKAVFYRDGRLLGKGEEWNETQALKGLHLELQKQGWIDDSSVWVAAEVSKDAEGLRMFSFLPQTDNPLVGQYIFPFDDSSTAIVCTTGRPYLTQGTAAPIKVSVVGIHGDALILDVLEDLVWQADMSFTKLDTGLSLPWVLHVADAGALQLARHYRISGVTA